ncbi:uncharacterized protein LOC113220347 [Piliocolobus tephrosceles]|uniref:uncharacterized protein LOC113220347 n=1 Tax=Piliocolobus tephrosceles TaxID=591936 RepID=UPI000E6AEBE1|nr:uncharacterized protein LOC113220347 [Piliocolobus tephrosceles]
MRSALVHPGFDLQPHWQAEPDYKESSAGAAGGPHSQRRFPEDPAASRAARCVPWRRARLTGLEESSQRANPSPWLSKGRSSLSADCGRRTRQTPPGVGLSHPRYGDGGRRAPDPRGILPGLRCSLGGEAPGGVPAAAAPPCIGPSRPAQRGSQFKVLPLTAGETMISQHRKPMTEMIIGCCSLEDGRVSFKHLQSILIGELLTNLGILQASSQI